MTLRTEGRWGVPTMLLSANAMSKKERSIYEQINS